MSDKTKHLVVNIDKSVAGSVLNEFAKQVQMAKNKPEIDKVSKFKEIVECLESVCTLLDDLEMTSQSDKIMNVLEDIIAKNKKEEAKKEKASKKKNVKKASAEEYVTSWETDVQNAKIKIASFLKKTSK
jgi:hypothetical protein